MDRYGLVSCPHCGEPLAADLLKKTMTCICGQSFELKSMRPKFTSQSPSQVADAVAMAKLKTADEKIIKPSTRKVRSRLGRLAAKAESIKDSQERLTYIASELTRLRKELSVEDLEKVHDIMGKESPIDMLVAMRENGIIYESSKGKYRAV